jgi:hypothetical protein
MEDASEPVVASIGHCIIVIVCFKDLVVMFRHSVEKVLVVGAVTYQVRP